LEIHCEGFITLPTHPFQIFEFKAPYTEPSFLTIFAPDKFIMPGKAIYIEADGSLTIKTITTSYVPEPNELLISVIYTGCNPADSRHALELGIRSNIAGYDFGGKVKAVGSACTQFKVGDIVAGTTPSPGIGRPDKYGAHQDEIICPENRAFLVPEGTPLEAAAVLAVVVRTASDGLTFLLDFKWPDKPASAKIELGPTGSLLIWGAGTSCGFSAVQIAKLCGAYPIVVTSSPQHHSRLRELGATDCFDYRSATVVDDIKALGAELCGPGGIRNGFDCIGLAGKERRDHLGAVTAAACGKDAKIVTVIPIPGSPFLEAWATPEEPSVFKPSYLGGEREIYTPVDAARAALSKKTLAWVVENYGEGRFVVPNIRIIKGGAENALKAVLEVADLNAGLTKVAIMHPYS
jgi:NADPH:quinone reductase-like Zn-dependent oxidoreductase